MTTVARYGVECDGDGCEAYVPLYSANVEVAEQYARDQGWQQVMHEDTKIHYCLGCKDPVQPDWVSE